MDFHCRVNMRTHVNFTRVNKSQPRSTFKFTRGLSYIAYISFTSVNGTITYATAEINPKEDFVSFLDGISRRMRFFSHK